MNISTVEEENLLIQEFKYEEEKILKELYSIIVYSETPLQRNDLFAMSYKEKELLLQIINEKRESEKKNVK